MTSVPPHDPRLPRLADVLDGSTVIALFGDHLPLLRCRPRYVRYKPGTSCLVQYDVTVRQPDGTGFDTTAHLTMYDDDRGRHRAGSARMRRLIDRATPDLTGIAGPPVAYVPGLGALVQVFPVDHDLRALVRFADAAPMRKIVSRSLPQGTGKVRDARPRLVRYKPGRKALFMFGLDDGAHDLLYAKLLDDDRGATVFAATAALRHAGVDTPRALLYSPRFHLIAHESAPGSPLASFRGTLDLDAWMGPVAASLARLQAVALPDLPVQTLTGEAGTVVKTARWLSRICPELTTRLTRVGSRIANALEDQADDLRTVHGDFYDDQVLVSGSGVAIIDLDEVRQAHPLTDVGNMLGHLSSGQATGHGTGAAHEAFLRAALADAPYRVADVAPFEAAALLKLAPGPFRRLETNWRDGIERIVGLAESCLGDGVRSFRGAIPIETAVVGDRDRDWDRDRDRPPEDGDATLPQLHALQDHRQMSQALSGLGALLGIELVRHKPGRRVLLRYTVERHDGGTEHLYGKSFASKRGGRVFATARLIAAARAFGTDILVPDPIMFLPDLKLMVQRSVPGEPVGPALLDGDRDLARRIATAFHRLHTSGIDLGRRHDMVGELAPLLGRAGDIGDRAPGLSPRAAVCLARVQEIAREADWSWRWRPIHRDAYHDQMLVDGDRLAILDLDDAAMSEPAVDIANIAAHLRLLAIQRPDRAIALDPVIAAFLDRSRELDPALDPALLDVLRATTLLRLAGIHIGRPDGVRVATALLADCADILGVSS